MGAFLCSILACRLFNHDVGFLCDRCVCPSCYFHVLSSLHQVLVLVLFWLTILRLFLGAACSQIRSAVLFMIVLLDSCAVVVIVFACLLCSSRCFREDNPRARGNRVIFPIAPPQLIE